MSKAEVDRFMQDVRRMPSLATSLRSLGQDVDKIMVFAAANGYGFTAEEAAAIAAPQPDLSDEGLDKVAGGWSIGCDRNTINPTIKCS